MSALPATAEPAEDPTPQDAARSDAVSARVASDGTGQTVQFISFTIDQDEYGVDIMAVREIKGWTGVTALPNQPDYMRGVLNLRGVIVPIYDMRRRFGMEQIEPTAMHVVIIVAVQDRIIGLLVDMVSDIVTTNNSEIRPVPAGRPRDRLALPDRPGHHRRPHDRHPGARQAVPGRHPRPQQQHDDGRAAIAVSRLAKSSGDRPMSNVQTQATDQSDGGCGQALQFAALRPGDADRGDHGAADRRHAGGRRHVHRRPSERNRHGGVRLRQRHGIVASRRGTGHRCRPPDGLDLRGRHHGAQPGRPDEAGHRGLQGFTDGDFTVEMSSKPRNDESRCPDRVGSPPCATA